MRSVFVGGCLQIAKNEGGNRQPQERQSLKECIHEQEQQYNVWFKRGRWKVGEEGRKTGKGGRERAGGREG